MIDFFETIKKIAKESFGYIEKESTKSSHTLCENARKTADYQASYDSLMNDKRVRTLSTAENKRARILKSNIDYYESLREKEFSDIKMKLVLGEISESEYYEELSRLRDSYFEKGSAGWNKYTAEIIKYNKDVVSNQQKDLEKIFSDLEEKYSKSFESILEKQNNMHKKLDNGFKIYESVELTMPDGSKIEKLNLSDIDEDLEILKKYNNSLINAKEKISSAFKQLGLDEEKSQGLLAEFFEQIADLSIKDGYQFSNHINFKSDSELLEYIGKWVEKADLTDEISKNLYADESSQIMKNYAGDISEAFSKTLQQKFGEVPSTFFTNGEQSALQFKSGFISAIDGVMSEISIKINKMISDLMPDLNVLSQGDSIINNSNYNIYGQSSPGETALEIFKQEEKKKMLIGE